LRGTGYLQSLGAADSALLFAPAVNVPTVSATSAGKLRHAAPLLGGSSLPIQSCGPAEHQDWTNESSSHAPESATTF